MIDIKCPKCNEYFDVKSSYDTADGRIRHRICKSCGYEDRFVEIPLRNYKSNIWLIKQFQLNIRQFMEMRKDEQLEEDE